MIHPLYDLGCAVRRLAHTPTPDRTGASDPADSTDAYTRLLDELEDCDEEDEADV